MDNYIISLAGIASKFNISFDEKNKKKLITYRFYSNIFLLITEQK